MTRPVIIIFYACLTLFISLANQEINAQSCIPGSGPTTINLSCGVVCTDLSFRVPDLKQSGNYALLPITYSPYAFTSAAPAVDFSNGIGWPSNTYGPLTDLGFSFCFFDTTFSRLSVGANGLVSFDASVANRWCDPRVVGQRGPNPLPSAVFARSIIAGVLHDLDPLDTARVTLEEKVEFRVEGNFPCRRAIISYHKVPMWPGLSGNCQSNLVTTQIVIYESSGLVDVYVKDKEPCLSHMEGRSILGIQNWARDKAVTPRDFNCTVWGSNNMDTAFRFVPSAGASRLYSTGLYLNGTTLVASGDTVHGNPGELIVNFDSICPPSTSNFYVFKAFFYPCPLIDNVLVEFSDTVYINRTGQLNATANVIPAACNSSTGTITVNLPPNVGTPPFTYTLNGGSPQASNVFNNLPAGNYIVLVEDASGCSSTLNLTVSQVNSLSVNFVTVTPSCNGANDGSISVNTTNGTPPFLYSINGGAFQNNSTFGGLAGGSYVINVVDAAGCATPDLQVNLPSGAPLSATATWNNVRCNGNNDGSLYVTVTSGSAPYSFSLDSINYQSGNGFTGLGAGIYNVHFLDNNGCRGKLIITIEEPPLLEMTIAVEQVLCNGEDNGQITVFPTGGMPGYTYSIDGTNYQNQNSFSVMAGNYNVHVKDLNGCIVDSSIVVTEPTAIQATISTRDATCGGGNDGQIIVTASGATAPYSFSLDGINFQQSATLLAPPGNHTVTVKDANACLATFNAVVGLNNTLTVKLDDDTAVCLGNSVQLNAESLATSYSWSPAAGLNDTQVPDPIASPLVTTAYELTARLGACVKKDTIVVNVLPLPVASAGGDGIICFGESHTLEGSGATEFLWSPDDYLDDAGLARPTATPPVTTTYFLHVTDNNGCRSAKPDTAIVYVHPAVKVIASRDTIVSSGDIIQLFASGGIDYQWTPSAGLSDPTIPDPLATIFQQISYQVTVMDAKGCKGSDTVNIKVFKGPDVYVPTGFTPNNDGRNDLFKPVYVGIKQLKYFRVYNRWGQLVFATSRTGEGWDGRIAGIPQPTGSFVWMIQCVTKEDKVIIRRGTVTLIR